MMPAGDICEMSLDGRSMFLIEGTATGPFDVRDSRNAVLATVTPDASGHFSALIPFGTATLGYYGNNNSVSNTTLTSVTRVPDFLDSMTSYACLFRRCTELTSVCDLPGSGKCTDMIQMFEWCQKLVKAPMIDMKNVTSLNNAFAYCSSLKDVPSYDTSNCKDYSGMFGYCSALEEAPVMDTSKGTRFYTTFRNCSSLKKIPLYDTSNSTSFSFMMQGCGSLKTVPHFDTSKGIDFQFFMDSCGSLTELPAFDFSSATNLSAAFRYCRSLTTLPALSFPKATTVSSMFAACTGLLSAPSYSFPEATDLSYLFDQCNNIKTIGILDTPKAMSVRWIFSRCWALENFPLRNTGTVIDFEYAFSDCCSLDDYYQLDYSKGTKLSALFQNTKHTSLPYQGNPQNTTFGGMVSSENLTSLTGIDMTSYRDGMGNPFVSTIAAEMDRTLPALTYIGALDGLSDNLDLSMVPNLTRESLVAIFNSIANVSSDPKTLTLGASNLGRLSASDQAIASAKGWTLQ